MKTVKKTRGLPALFCLNSTGAPLQRREDCPLWERVSQCYALLILTLFPLLPGSDRYYNITVSKFRYFAVLTGVYVALCLLIGFIWRPGKKVGSLMRKRTKPRLTAPQILLLVYVLWAVICVLRSPYQQLWIGQSRYEGMLSILLYSTAFLLLSFWGEYTDAYTYGLGAMGIAAGFIAVLQSLDVSVIYDRGQNYWNTHFLATIGHEDCVACFVCILVPAMLCGFVILKSGWRWLGIPTLFFMTYIAVFTDVDTAKLGFLVPLLLLPCLIESRERLQRLLVGLIPILLGAACGFLNPESRSPAPPYGAAACFAAAAGLGLAAWLMSRSRRVWSVSPARVRRTAYIIMLVLLIAALLVLYNYHGNNRLLREASELLHGELSDEAGTTRGYIWKCTVKIIREHPVFGGGPGSFPSLFYPYNEGYMAASHTKDWIDFPHNDFLAVGACTGLVGLALYLVFLIALALRCIRAAYRSPVMLIFLGGMAGYLTYSFFVFSIAIVTPLFWVLAGLADKCVRQLEIPEPPEQ